MIGLKDWARVFAKALTDPDCFKNLNRDWRLASEEIVGLLNFPPTVRDQTNFYGNATKTGFQQTLIDVQRLVPPPSLNEGLITILATCRPRCVPDQICLLVTDVNSSSEIEAVRECLEPVVRRRDDSNVLGILGELFKYGIAHPDLEHGLIAAGVIADLASDPKA